MKIIILLMVTSFSLMAEQRGNWKPFESPFLIIAQKFEQNFNKLPYSGRLSKRPWSDTYWATWQGGLSVRWSGKERDFGYKLLTKDDLAKIDLAILSPAEKWDLFMGDSNWTLTKEERQRTEILKTVKGSPEYKRGFEIPKWYGLCHAWAPATLLYDSPGPITLENSNGIKVPFYASDIKALLTYNLHIQGENTKTYFMGSRCNVTLPKYLKALTLGMLTEKEYVARVKNENCNDMDAGATHLAMANLIGLKNTGFVMDMTRGAEVWNQAVYSYSSKILGTTVPKKKRNEVIDPILGVSKILTLKTDVVYITEISPNKEGKNFPKNSLRDVIYNYEVHLNASGEIVGGKWLDANRPDFFWRSEDPGFSPVLSQLENVYRSSALNAPYESRVYSKEQIKTLFKDRAKAIIVTKRFIKNSAQLAQERRDKRIDYFNNVKNDMINNVASLLDIFK